MDELEAPFSIHLDGRRGVGWVGGWTQSQLSSKSQPSYVLKANAMEMAVLDLS